MSTWCQSKLVHVLLPAVALAAIALTLAFASGWLGAHPAAAFKLVDCPANAAPSSGCPAAVPTGAPSSVSHSAPWLAGHQPGSWLPLLLCGTVAISEAARVSRARHGSLRDILPARLEGLRLRLGQMPPASARRLALCGLLALGALALGVVGFSRPSGRDVVVSTPYQQHGSFSYTAPTSGSIYDGDTARTGQPVFPRLSRQVDFTFAYSFVGPSDSQLSGGYWLTAVVSDRSGWSKSIELHPQTGFSGSGFNASGTLDLTALQGIIDDYQRQTGAQPSSYRVSIVPQVQIHGTLAGATLDETFAPSLDFTLDQTSMRLADHAAGVDPLEPASQGSLPGLESRPAHVGIAGIDLPVGLLRWLAAAGLLAALAGASVIITVEGAAGPQDEAARIRARHGRRLVAIQRGSLYGASAIDVSDITDLGRLAARYRLPILVDEGAPTYYYVRQDSSLYRYRLPLCAPPGVGVEDELFA